MKKVFHMLFLALISILPAISSAALNFPDTISIGDAPSYDAGTQATLVFKDSMRPVGKLTNIEYGVAKATKRDDSTFFTLIKTEKKDLKNIESLPSLPIEIPNTVIDSATTTFVVYLKYYEENNPDAEMYFVTKEFKITPNDTPFTNIRHINLLQSNGYRFALTAGPSIYNPEYVKDFPTQNLSTTTSVEVTFNSNQETILNPIITFTKLRSDSFQKEVKLDPVTIKKGDTYAVIPLPTMDYQPGIYAGKLSFENEHIKNSVDVQYIVNGDAVTVGSVYVIKQDDLDVFNYEIFGVPVDLIREPDASTSTASRQKTYAVTTDYLDKDGKLVESLTQNVNFSEASFTTSIPKKKFFKTYIENIHIKVVSETGHIAFEGTKNVAYTSLPSFPIKHSYLYIIGFLVLLLIIVLIIAKRKKSAVITTLLVLVIASGFVLKNNIVFGQTNSEGQTEEQVQAATAAANASYATGWTTYGYQPTGISPYSSFWPSPAGNNGSGTTMPIGTWNDRNTQLFTQGFLPNYTFQCGQPVSFWYRFVAHACYNDSTTVNGTIYFGNYDGRALQGWYNHGGGGDHTGFDPVIREAQMSAPATIAAPVVTAATTQYLGWNQDSGWQTRQGGHWDYSLQLKNNCSLIPEKCTCSGRTQVCTKAGLAFTNTPNSPACAIQASCSVSSVTASTDNVTFTQTPTNGIGTITYTDLTTSQNDGAAAKTFSIIPGQTVIKKTRITDSFDNTSTTTICSALRPNSGDIVSACSGRDMVFTNTRTNTETNRIKNDASCALTASCSAKLSGDNVIFTNSTSNAIGSILYKDYNTNAILTNPRSVPILLGQTIVQRVVVTDRGDNASTTTTCAYTREPTVGVSSECACNANKDYSCSYSDGRAPTVQSNSPICSADVNTTTQCACSGRTYVCSNSSGYTVSSIANATQCAFRASCEITQVPGQSNVSIYNIVENALGTVSLKEVNQADGSTNGPLLSNPYSKVISSGQTLSVRTLVTDTDGASATTQCTIQGDSTQTCTCSGTTRTCTNPNGSVVSQVLKSPQCPTTTQCIGTTLVKKDAQGREIGRSLNSKLCPVNPGQPSCTCDGRNYVCKNGAGTVTSTSVNDNQCKFTASCTAQVVNGTVTFGQVLTNVLGNAVYKNTANNVVVNNPSSEPIGLNQTITRNTSITDTYDGVTVTTQCSATRTTNSTPSCACSGRDMICKDAQGGLISNTTGSPSCAFQATCQNPTIDTVNNTATFSFALTNRLGTASYKDQANPSVPFNTTVPLAAGGTIVRNIVVTDASDNSTSNTVCVATRAPDKGGCEAGLGYVIRNSAGAIVSSNPSDSRCTISNNYQCACEGAGSASRVCRDTSTNTVLSASVADTLLIAPLVCPDVPSTDAKIVTFKAVPPVVQRGEICNYVWSTANVNLCTLKINNVPVSLSGLSSTIGSLVTYSKVTGTDDSNQQAVLTCQKDATPTSPAVTVTSTAICAVNAAVIQR